MVLKIYGHVRKYSSGVPGNYVFYKGDRIFNQVTWNVGGTKSETLIGHTHCVGHKRLWNCTRGKVLDVSRIPGNNALFTTACFGTFYWSTICGPDWATLVIDGREGWCPNFINRYGTFEFEPSSAAYQKHMPNSEYLTGCQADYRRNGLMPSGSLADLCLGFRGAQQACKAVSNFDGILPVPPEVRMGIATLLFYGPESVKQYTAYDAANASLQYDSITLGQLAPGLIYDIKKWSFRSDHLLYNCCKMVQESHDSTFLLANETKTDNLLSEIAVVPYNRTIWHKGPLTRTWLASPMDASCYVADGKAHYLSQLFTPRQSPLVLQLLHKLPEQSLINTAEIINRGYKAEMVGRGYR